MFRTEIPLTPLSQQLPSSARVLTLGSCFSDSIGARLTEFKVATLVNPFGTVFNPISACKLLRAAAGEDVDWQQHLVEARGRWQSYDLHAEIGADSPVELLQHIQRLTREVGVFLATADVVVLTLGSAYAYRLRETGELISNCHKMAADKFDKELLTADELIAAVAETHAYLRRINPKLRFVLTVSPVRHLKDTLVLNSASKAMLRVACHYLSELLPDVAYFPAYELLVDDLRDYRFYATDMLHLSESAENYVWEKFTRTCFDAAFGRFKKEWEGIRQNLNHRPLHPAAPEHRAFLESTLERLRQLGGTTNVRMEMLHVERELANLPTPKPLVSADEEAYDDGEERIDIGSSDEPVTLPEARPAALPTPAALAEAITNVAKARVATPPAVKPATAAMPPRRTSQASLLKPGWGMLVEDAEDDEPATDELPEAAAPNKSSEAQLAQSEAASPAESAESAYDYAYSPASNDGLTDAVEEEEDADEAEGDDTAEATGPETAEEAARRKKRRSRGGAKRTKRKHARLAAEQAGEEQSEESVVATAPAPLPVVEAAETIIPTAAPDDNEEPASEMVYVTEESLRQPRPRPTVAPADDAPAVAPVVLPEGGPAEPSVTDETATEAEEPAGRRSRNNRRGNKREQAPRYGGRPGRQPLYAVDADGLAPIEAPLETDAVPVATTPFSAPVESSAPIAAAPVAPVADITAAPKETKRSSRSGTRKAPVVDPTPMPEPTTPETALPEASPVTPEPAPMETAPAKPTRRKPAPKPAKLEALTTETVAPAEPEATQAAATLPTPAEPAAEPAKAPAKKRAAAKPKAAGTKVAAYKAPAKPRATKTTTTVAPETPAVAEAPTAAPEKTAKAKEAPKVAAKAKPAPKKAPAKAAARVVTDAPAASTKAPAKTRAKAAAKPAKTPKPEAPDTSEAQ